MFVVTDADAAAIRAVFQQSGEFAAAVELRRLFPGVTDNAQARECARTIAGRKPLPRRPDGVGVFSEMFQDQWRQAMTLAECNAAVILAAVAGLGCM